MQVAISHAPIHGTSQAWYMTDKAAHLMPINKIVLFENLKDFATRHELKLEHLRRKPDKLKKEIVLPFVDEEVKKRIDEIYDLDWIIYNKVKNGEKLPKFLGPIDR